MDFKILLFMAKAMPGSVYEDPHSVTWLATDGRAYEACNLDNGLYRVYRIRRLKAPGDGMEPVDIDCDQLTQLIGDAL